MENTNIKPLSNKNICVNFHGELMENHFIESTIDKVTDIKSIQYSNNKAMVLFIDKYHQLILLVNKDNSDSGWESLKLSSKNMKVTSFDLYHNKKTNSAKIIYAGLKDEETHLLISEITDLSVFTRSLSNISLSWEKKQLPYLNRVIDHISMNKDGVLIASSHLNSDATYSYFVYGEEIKQYTLPENGSKVLQLEIGKYYDKVGVFILYEVGQDQTMLFKSFPKGKDVLQRRFNTGSKINAFSLISDETGECTLYTSGKGVYRFKAYTEKEKIVSSETSLEFSKVISSSNKDEVSLWLIGKESNKSDSSIYHCTNRFYYRSNDIMDQKWTKPLIMHEHVDEFCAIKGDSLLNQLFLLRKNEQKQETLIHLWQDEKTTYWYEQVIHTNDTEEWITKETFTLNIEFKSDNISESLHGQKVQLSAESNMYVYINGKYSLIGPKHPIETSIDVNQINIIYPTKSISSPKLYLHAKFLSEDIEIDMAKNLNKQIKENFSNKKTLKTAQKQNGEKLISSDISDDDIKQVTEATKKVFNHIETTQSKQKEELNLQTPMESIEDSIIMSNNLIAVESIPYNSVVDTVSDIGHSIGDIWHSVKKGFTKVAHMAIETLKDGVKFILKIGETVFNWVSNAISDSFHFLERVWEKIKIFFKDIFEFLAFLFKWEDIIHTKRVLKEYLNNAIGGLENNIHNIRKESYKFFNSVEGNIKDLKNQIKFDQFNKHSISSLHKENDSKDGHDPRSSWLNSKKHHLSSSHVQNTIDAVITPKIGTPLNNLMVHIERIGEKLAEVFTDLLEKFLALIQGNAKIGDFIQYFVLSLLEFGVDVAKEIIDLIFELVEESLKVISSILNGSIDIPFFSKLYMMISGDKLSLNDLICLLISIPLTVLYKIGEGKAPFKNVEEKNEFINSSQLIFQPVSMLVEH